MMMMITNSVVTKVRDGAQNIHHRLRCTLLGEDDTDACSRLETVYRHFFMGNTTAVFLENRQGPRTMTTSLGLC